MADMRTCIKTAGMKLADFNKTLLEACQQAPITSITAEVVSGEPVLVLLSDIVEADDEMVKEAKEVGEDIKVGDPVPDGDPLVAQVVRLSVSEEGAGRSSKSFDTLRQRIPDVAEVRIIKGPHEEWIYDRNDLDKEGNPKPNAKLILVQGEVAYAVVISYAQAPEEQE